MDRLDAGVARGIITAEQRDALRALDVGSPAPMEAQRGLNAVTVAYWVGGIAVLGAFGWFLVRRWDVLGAGGVLVVSVVYAAVFALTARVFAAHGFRHASAVATVLVVGMTPVVAWASLSLAGLWDLYPGANRSRGAELFDPIWDALRWLPVDLATILAALIALRRVRFGVLALPTAVALAAAASHVVPLFIDNDLARSLGGRLPLLLAVVLFTIGYALDVRQTDDEDYAFWFYVVGLAPLIQAIGSFFGESSTIAAHGMLGASALLAIGALRMRRRLLLLAAFIGFVAYLSYLAFDLFKNTLAFPVALATVGIVVILTAVWLQRRYPAIVRGTEEPGPRYIPGAPLGLASALIIACVLIVAGIPDARQRTAGRYWREAFERRRSHNQQMMRAKTITPRP